MFIIKHIRPLGKTTGQELALNLQHLRQPVDSVIVGVAACEATPMMAG